MAEQKNGLEGYFVTKGSKKLRYGYTTGSCAAAAAKAATWMLLSQKKIEKIDLLTPRGILLHLMPLDVCFDEQQASCAIRKDGGDDPDATDGLLVYAVVSKCGKTKGEQVFIDGGKGVGRITKPGLEQPVGAAAINRVPREMITEAVREVCEMCEYTEGIQVCISIPGGEEVAKKTFNPRLGIEGGLSVLGTSGIVVPMSEKALIASIRLEMEMKRKNGAKYLLLTPGNYGADFVKENTKLDVESSMKCSNYVGETLDMAELQEIWESKLEPVYPYRKAGPTVEKINGKLNAPAAPKIGVAKPKVIIPVFPGNNCEYDSARAFRAAGAEADTFVINNLTPEAVAESTHELARRIRQSQIVMIPGGFSGGDEPDGSAKFITAFFRAPEVTEAVRDLLKARDGLMLGICNGFQALIKLGLVPYGDIVDATPDAPTLTFNTIGRHQSRLVRTRISSNLSPWLSQCSLDDPYTVAISHGEGRFVANDEVLAQLIANGQVATQYVGENGKPSMDLSVNPNGSALAIEGITSPDGHVLGKMGHTERAGAGLYKNTFGNTYQPLFEGGVDYFRTK